MDALVGILLTNAAAAGLIALLAWAASRTLRRQSVVHGLWLLALVKLVTPPIAPLPLIPSWPDLDLRSAPPAPTVVPMPPAAGTPAVNLAAASLAAPAAAVWRATAPATRATPSGGSARVAPAPATPPPKTAVPPPIDWRAAVWLSLVVGALAISGLTAWRFARFRRLLACARPAPPAIASRALALAAGLGLRRPPPLLLVPARIPPMLWPDRAGPRLLLPCDLLPDLSGAELDALLAHELAHVRRRDHWVRLVEVAATALFWWYPITWWARRSLRRAEERCCDEWVLRLLPRSAEAYASGLLKSLTFVSEPAPLPAVASGAGPVGDLEARLKEILMTRPLPRLAVPVRLALATAALIGLAVFPTDASQSSGAKEEPAPPATATPATAAPAAPPATAPPSPAPRAARPPVAARPPRALLLGVPGDVVGGMLGGVRAIAPADAVGSAPHALLGPAGLSGDRERPTAEQRVIDEQRRALEEQRRKLHQQEQELERQSLELEAKAEQSELAAEAARLRGEGRTAEAEQAERKAQLSARRFDLQKRQLQLQMDHDRLAAEMERSERESEDRVTALEAAGKEQEADALRSELDRAGGERNRASRELEEKQQALEAEMEQAEKELEAVAAEEHVQELRSSTEDLARSLAEQIDSLKEALPEAGSQKADLEHEIQKLEAALDALRAGSSPRPRPQVRETPRPQPSNPAPRPSTP
jgi:beta-lactamase regulating signal transducer with metallopeptidase domain